MTRPASVPAQFVHIHGRSGIKQRGKARKRPLAESIRKVAQKNKPHVDWNKFLEIRKNSRIAAALTFAPDAED